MAVKLSTDVVIVGAGPVGLSLAIELGLQGISCILLERRDGSVPLPKMSGVTPRGMEICRRWGIADQVRKAGIPENHPGDIVYITNLCGQELARWVIPPANARGRRGYTPEPPCKCSQIFFDPILASFAKTLKSLEIKYETELTSFYQDDTGVTSFIRNSNGEETEIKSLYLVGCDGPSGIVRPSIGIDLEGLGVVANSTNIFLRSKELSTLHDKDWAHVYRAIDETGCWSELIPINDTELWRLTVFDNLSHRIPANELVEKFVGRKFSFEILSVMTWERRDFLARNYSVDRVIIAGDAAHECSPTGGLGMHTGIEEALNLGWKLSAMIQGWGGPSLLASYEAERRPIALRNVSLATRSYHSIEQIPGYSENDPDWEKNLRENLDRFIVTEHLRMQYCYENSPICISDGTPPVAVSHLQYTSSARPGTRAPHMWIEENRSIIDLFGQGFTLLRLGPDAPEANELTLCAKSKGVPISVFHIPDKSAEELYESRICLVRPDGHVAFRSQNKPLEPEKIIDCVRGA